VSATFHLQQAILLALTILVTSLAFNTMMFLLMVRVEDPLVPRATFGVLNTLLFFPSGAIYPINAFPKWLQAVAIADPFSYAVHAFKALLLKEAGLVAIWHDLAFLSIFAVIMISIAAPLFRRTL
jgi:ABC-2 type transport system permease protein